MTPRLFILAVLAFTFAAIAAPKPAAEPRTRPGAPAPRAAAFTFGIEPVVPAWVVPARESAAATARAALHYSVIDDQTRVDDQGVARYSRVVRVVDETAGLGSAAQIEIEFDPSYQTLVFHHVDVLRDGKRSSRLDRRKVQLLQRETQLERRMYDGRVTASTVLDDVRVGDQIDIAYSVRGSNPVFGGRFVAAEWMSPARGPVALYQYRLLAPESRKIAYRAGSPDMKVETRVERGVRETLFRRESVPMLHLDSGAPYSAVLSEQVQFSEFADWADVARWGTALFEPASAAAVLLDQKAAEIRAASPDPEARLLAALHFVQADVRYFGTEVGMNSHRPENPEKVLQQRFGDCKDKVGLFAALLRRLDIAATPVLVSTLYRGSIESMLPSPLAFDHVIARVELGGRTHWLDATRSHQTGVLASRQSIGLQRGLPLAAQVADLAVLPAPYDTERMSVADVFRIAKFADGPMLESRITYRGDMAEAVREALATRNLADLEPQLIQPYARAYPKLRRSAPTRVEQSVSDDAVTIVQSFAIPDFWRFPEQRALVADLIQWAVIDAVRPPNEPTRRNAFMLYAGIHRHVTTIEYPEDVIKGAAPQQFNDGDARVSLRTRAEFLPRHTEVSSELRIAVDEIPAADWPAYTAQINKFAPRLALAITVPAIGIGRLEKLRLDMKATDEALKLGKTKVASKVQFDALAKSLMLSSQLEEDRLPAGLRAEALTARGIQYDNLGRLDVAAKDFALALELAPDARETLNGAAVNAIQLADYPRALVLTEQVLAKSPSDTEALNTRALAHVFMKDYVAAKAAFEQMLKDGAQVRRGYPMVWLAILERRTGGDPAQSLARFGDDRLPTDWPRPIVDWARGVSTAEALVGAAKAGRGAAEQLCEAYYYIGERYLAEGDTRRATEYFRKAVDQGIVEFVEDGSARNRLASLASPAR